MVINWDDVDRMTPEEIENIRVEVLKEIKIMEDNYFIVKEAYQQKAREIINLEGEKKDLQISMSKSKHMIDGKKSEVEILTSKFWRKRKGF